jgi:hypothetical protein
MVTIFKQYQKEYFKRVPQKDPKEVQKLLDEYNKKHRKEPEPKPQQPLSGPPVPENSKTEIKPAPKLSSEPAKARDEVMIEEKPKDVKQAVPKVSDIR